MLFLKRAAALRAMNSGQPPVTTPVPNGGDSQMRVDTEQPSGNPVEVKDTNGGGPEATNHSDAQTRELLLLPYSTTLIDVEQQRHLQLSIPICNNRHLLLVKRPLIQLDNLGIMSTRWYKS